MKETRVHPSLLSYLLPEHREFCLRLQLTAPHKSPKTSPSSPFTALNDEDPLAHTFRGAFVTDFGSIIKEVNFLIQRDTIKCPAEQKPFLNNTIIDQYWQQAMTVRHARTPDHSILLATQIDRQQQLLAFASLFYCREKKLFFEIPCPECGQTLQLCKDGDLLQRSGLSPYATSLHRYLFCPSCFQRNNQSKWYTLERQVEDPSTVHDCRQLFIDLSKLDSDIGKSSVFPCSSCQQHELCYGKQQAVHDTIFILSFYPFYMLITECDSLDGFHLLTLLTQNQFLSSHEPSPSSDSIPFDTNQEKEENHDREILSILQKLAEKYQRETSQNHLENPPQKNHEILKAKEVFFETKCSPQGEDISHGIHFPIGNGSIPDDLSQETVIIGSPTEYSLNNRDPLQTETITLSGNSSMNQNEDIQSQPDNQIPENKTITEDDDLAETIIIRPGQKL